MQADNTQISLFSENWYVHNSMEAQELSRNFHSFFEKLWVQRVHLQPLLKGSGSCCWVWDRSLGCCMSRDPENSNINMGFRLCFPSVNRLQVHKEGLWDHLRDQSNFLLCPSTKSVCLLFYCMCSWVIKMVARSETFILLKF